MAIPFKIHKTHLVIPVLRIYPKAKVSLKKKNKKKKKKERKLYAQSFFK